MRKVLVTGASGFIGRAACAALVSAGCDAVIGMARRLPADADKTPGVTYVVGDVRRAESLDPGFFEGGTHIVHLVGIIAEEHGAGQTFDAVHVRGTDALLRAARRAGFSGTFLYLSALGASPTSPSAYARSKAQAERLVRESGLPCAILRPSVVLGPGGDFVRQIEALIRRAPLSPFPLPFVPIPGRGRNQFQPLFIDDLTEGIVRSLEQSGEAEGQQKSELIEVGGADAVTFNDLIAAFQRRIGDKKPLLHAPMPLLFAAAAVLEGILPRPPITTDQLLQLKTDNVCDNANARRLLGIEPLGFEAMLDRIYGAGG